LEEFEARRFALYHQRRQLVGITVGVVTLLVLVVLAYRWPFWWGLLAGLPVVALSAYLYRAWFTDPNLGVAIQQMLAAELLPRLFVGAQYDRERCVPYRYLADSQLMAHLPESYGGQHLVKGQDGDVPFLLSEVTAFYQSGDPATKGQEQVLLDGLLFVTLFRRDFVAPVLVLPDDARQRLGRLGRKLQLANLYRPPYVELFDDGFANHFAIHTTHIAEAKQVLDAQTRQQMVNLKANTGLDIYLSLVGNRITIALDGPLISYDPAQRCDTPQYVLQYYEKVSFLLAFGRVVNDRLAPPQKAELSWEI
jgi:hypothetical protein